MPSLKFNFNQLLELSNDFAKSKRAIPAIARHVLREKFRALRRELAPEIPRLSGALRRSFGFSVRSKRGLVTGKLGFRSRDKRTIIAANVLQAGGANITAKKGKYLWVPMLHNVGRRGEAAVTPRALISAGGFVRKTESGAIAYDKQGIALFVLRRHVRIDAEPVPIEERVEQELPAITDAIEQTIAQVIEARKALIETG